MNTRSKLAALAVSAGLVFSAATLCAQDPHHDDHDHGRDNRGGYDNHGGPGYQGRPGGPGFNGGPGGGPHGNWREDRGHWNNYYGSDAARWRGRRDRPRFYTGYRIPRNYALQPVPAGYYNGYAPLQPGYQYGYYDGYVVSYNPATRIIADVLDLAAASTR